MKHAKTQSEKTLLLLRKMIFYLTSIYVLLAYAETKVSKGKLMKILMD